MKDAKQLQLKLTGLRPFAYLKAKEVLQLLSTIIEEHKDLDLSLEELEVVKTSIMICADLIDVDVESVVNLFALAYSYQSSDVKGSVEKALEELIKYKLETLKVYGLYPQMLVMTHLCHTQDIFLLKNRKLVLRIIGFVLSLEFESFERKDYNTVAFGFGGLGYSEQLVQVREQGFALLKKLFDLSEAQDERLEVLHLMEELLHLPRSGTYSDEIENLVIQNAESLVDFYTKLVRTNPSLDVSMIHVVDIQLSWLERRFKGRTIRGLENLRSMISEIKGFKIYTLIVGNDTDYPDDINWGDRRELRAKKVEKLIKGFDEDSFGELVTAMTTVGEGLNTLNSGYYPFESFLETLAKEKPFLASKLLKSKLPNFKSFIIPLLKGLCNGAAHDIALSFCLNHIQKGAYLEQIALLPFYLESIELDILGKCLFMAKAKENEKAVENIVRSIMKCSDEPNATEFIFIDALSFLTNKRNCKWVINMWPKRDDFFNVLSFKGVNIVLENLEWSPVFSSDMEDVLNSVLSSHPKLALNFLKNRVSRESKPVEGISYDAIPYDFYGKSAHWELHSRVIIDAIVKWFEKDDWFFRWNGAHLLKIGYPGFDTYLEKKLMVMIDKDQDKYYKAIVRIVSEYGGSPILYRLIEHVVLKNNSKPYWGDLYASLTSTDFVTGEYGLVEAFNQKKLSLRGSKIFQDKRLEDFTNGYVHYIDNLIDYEMKNADREVAINRYLPYK